MNKKDILDSALSPFAEYSNGFGSPGNSGIGYILTPLLATGKDKVKFNYKDSTGLDEINAFDIAEVENAYIGQLNLIQVSSFCGPQGLIWGYDIAQKNVSGLESLLSEYCYNNINGNAVMVYSAWPLIEACIELYGSREAKRFPIIPGSHVPAAYKKISFCNVSPREETHHLYCSLALGVPKDRKNNAVLLMEDVGSMPYSAENSYFSKKHLLDALVRSVIQIGENQLVEYEKIYVAFKDIIIEPQEVGCALVVAPYIALARNAIPAGGTEQLAESNLIQWKTSLNR